MTLSSRYLDYIYIYYLSIKDWRGDIFPPRTGMSTDDNLKGEIKENECEHIKAQWGNIEKTIYKYIEINIIE